MVWSHAQQLAFDNLATILAVLPTLPLQGEEFCSTEAGGLIESLVGIMIVMFFAALVVAVFAAAGIEALPMTGWWNQMGYSMMGKIPVAVGFVFIALALLSMVDGTFGISAPACVPVVGVVG